MVEKKVAFPLGGHKTEIACVSVRPQPDYEGQRKEYIVVLDDDGRRDHVKTVLNICRRGGNAVDLKEVVVEFCSVAFTGNSYGLAVAIADKLARLAPDIDRQIVATGDVDVAGTVTEAGSFPEKLANLKMAIDTGKEIKTGALFVYPAANKDKMGPEEKKLLGELADRGIELRSVRQLADLTDLWDAPEKEVSKFLDGDRQTFLHKLMRWAKIGIVLLLVIIVCIFWAMHLLDLGIDSSVHRPEVEHPAVFPADSCSLEKLEALGVTMVTDPGGYIRHAA
jgi:hypothetical protein